MSWQSKIKTAAKFASPAVRLGDFAKDVVDPRTDVFRNVDYPYNNKPSNSPLSLGKGLFTGSPTSYEHSGRQVGESAANPNQYSTPGGGGRSSGGGSTSAADLAYLDTQERLLRSMLGRSSSTLNQGLSALSDSFNRETGKANEQRSRALEDFAMKRESTDLGKNRAIEQVDTNARTLNDSLRRMLGMASGSGSSAYMYTAPNAVAREASGERTDVLSDYADNYRSIDLAERRAQEDFDALLEELGRQKASKEQELRSGIVETESDLQMKLADLAAKRAAVAGGGYDAIMAAQEPYASAVTSNQSKLDALFNQFRNPVYDVKPVEVQAPTLRDYMVDRAGISASQSGGDTQYSPYSYFLKRQQEQTV